MVCIHNQHPYRCANALRPPYRCAYRCAQTLTLKYSPLTQTQLQAVPPAPPNTHPPPSPLQTAAAEALLNDSLHCSRLATTKNKFQNAQNAQNETVQVQVQRGETGGGAGAGAVAGAGGASESANTYLLALRAQNAELEATMHTQKRQMALQCETLVAERNLARKQRDAMQERVGEAEVALDKALEEMPRLRRLEQMHVSCQGSLEAETAALKVAQEEVQRLQAIESQHKACPDSIVNLENMIHILRRKVTDCEEAADKRQQRLEQALQVAELAHEQRLTEMAVLRQENLAIDLLLQENQALRENQALGEKSEDSTLTRSNLSPPPPLPPPLPGNSPARRLCGVGLFLAVYDDHHFKAGSIYVEEVIAGGAAADCGLIARNDVLVSVNDKTITQLSHVYTQVSSSSHASSTGCTASLALFLKSSPYSGLL